MRSEPARRAEKGERAISGAGADKAAPTCTFVTPPPAATSKAFSNFINALLLCDSRSLRRLFRSAQFVDPGFVRFDLERYLKWSTWVSCGRAQVGGGGGGARREVVGVDRAPDIEAARVLEDAGGGDEGGDASVGGGGGADEEGKGLIIISEGGAQEQPGNNILLGNGGLEELSRIIERECATWRGVHSSTIEKHSCR